MRSTHGFGGRAAPFLITFASLVGFAAALAIATNDGQIRSDAKFVGIPAMLFAWAILHFGYAERYGREKP